LKVIYSTSSNSVAYRKTLLAGRKIKLCVVRGSLGRDLGRGLGLGRGQSACKYGRRQNEQDIARRSSASDGVSETDQVERLGSVGGDGGIGAGTGDNGGSGDDSEGGGDGNKPLNPAAGLWSRFASFHLPDNFRYYVP
jgi:hypothetical protein